MAAVEGTVAAVVQVMAAMGAMGEEVLMEEMEVTGGPVEKEAKVAKEAPVDMTGVTAKTVESSPE